MGSRLSAPGPQEKRFAAYMDGLANARGHADRHTPLKNYCKGLLLPAERKSIEPMAARLAPDNVRRMHQSLHHLVADAPWDDEAVLSAVRRQVLPGIENTGPWWHGLSMNTGFPKQGKHSVGVARQYCGQIGEHDNGQAAVSLSVSNWNASLPVAWRLYLPELWCEDSERRQQAGIPEEIRFQSKPEIASGTDSAGYATECPGGSGAGGCRLWERHALARGVHRTRTAIWSPSSFDHSLGARATTVQLIGSYAAVAMLWLTV